MSGPNERPSKPPSARPARSAPPEGDAYRSVEIDLSALLEESEPARDSVEIDLSSFEPRASDPGPPPS